MKRIAIFVVALLLVLLAMPLIYFATVDLDDFQDPLLNASRDGNVDTINELLASGVDPNKTDSYGNTPLSIAAHFGKSETIELLLKSGAHIDGIDGKMSPLQCAAYSRHAETARLLLKYNADPNRADQYGRTPLAIAASHGDAILAKLLLEAGANVEQADKFGWRPLHVALRSTQTSNPGRLATVKTLLEYSADPNANNIGGHEKDGQHDSHIWSRTAPLPNEGNSPVAIAKSNGFVEIVDLLEANGGTYPNANN